MNPYESLAVAVVAKANMNVQQMADDVSQYERAKLILDKEAPLLRTLPKLTSWASHRKRLGAVGRTVLWAAKVGRT